MTASSPEIHIGLSMQDIDAEQWDRLANGQSPFLSHAFLWALEQSGSVQTDTGWQPCHLVITDNKSGHSRLLAAMPCT